MPAGALASLQDAEWVDRTRRPYVEGGIAWVPVGEGYPADTDLPEREPYRGRGYHLIGDIAVLHGEVPSEEELAAIVRHCRPRGIVRIRGYTGAMRVPDVEVLYGTAGEVRHREQGYTFILDPARVMFDRLPRPARRAGRRYVRRDRVLLHTCGRRRCGGPRDGDQSDSL